MRKTITYSGLGIAAFSIIVLFVTSQTYSQLILAIILYPVLAYFVLKFIPHHHSKPPSITIAMPNIHTTHKLAKHKSHKSDITDNEKREFIKLIGAAGISLFIFSIFGRRVESLLFGGQANSASGNTNSNENTSSPTEGFKISEIDEGIISYYGFINKNGGWLIMKEDSENSTFRYAKGASDFVENWQKRQDLSYDYYHNLR